MIAKKEFTNDSICVLVRRGRSPRGLFALQIVLFGLPVENPRTKLNRFRAARVHFRDTSTAEYSLCRPRPMRPFFFFFSSLPVLSFFVSSISYSRVSRKEYYRL